VFSGLPYTRLRNNGAGNQAPRQTLGLIGTQLEPINNSHMPWQKLVDMRVNKGFRVGRLDVTAFADGRNIFNFKNIASIFAETGDVVNALHRENTLSDEFARLAIEADANGALDKSTGDIDLRPSCTTWKQNDASTVNCVMLRRTEARFGDGNQVYTVAEQSNALNAFYDLFSGKQNFYGTPRNIRLGVELSF